VSFNSYVYVFAFLPVVFVGYQLVRTTRYANALLGIASAVFYGWLAAWYLIPLLISSVLDYFIGKRMAGEAEEAKRRRLLALSVTVNIGMLAAFKYTGWISAEIAGIAGIFGVSFAAVSFALPPGISFYTFQTMSYTIDVFKGEFKPRRNFVDYMSFVSFFPQLVAGPIERATHLLPQLERVRPRVSASVASGAMFMILFGLFQKTVLADNFGGIVDFAASSIDKTGATPLAPGMGLAFAYGFAFQIYCDFAAYSTIARGTARLFGIELMRNFATPYLSRNPSEFWTRWHISLSQWLRDYLYIPMGGSHEGQLKTLRNLVITMTLGGLWHGAGVFFVIWGLYHGLLLVLYRLVPIDVFLERRLGRFGQFVSTLIFFHLVCIGWIFFRASPDQFWPIVNSIVALPGALVDRLVVYQPYWEAVWVGDRSFWGTLLRTVKGVLYFQHNPVFLFWGIVLFGLPVLVTDWLGYRKGKEFADLWDSMPTWVRAVCTLALVYGIVFFARREANEFIYFQF